MSITKNYPTTKEIPWVKKMMKKGYMKQRKKKWKPCSLPTTSKGRSFKISYNKSKVLLRKSLSKKSSFSRKTRESTGSTSDGRRDMSGLRKRRKADKNSFKKKRLNFWINFKSTKTKTTREFTWIAGQKQTKHWEKLKNTRLPTRSWWTSWRRKERLALKNRRNIN